MGKFGPTFKLFVPALGIVALLHGVGVPAVPIMATHWFLFLPALIIVVGMAGVVGRSFGLQNIFHDDPELSGRYLARHGATVWRNSPAIFTQAAVVGSLVNVWGNAYGLGFSEPGETGVPPGLAANWQEIAAGVVLCGLLSLFAGTLRINTAAIARLQPGEQMRSAIGFGLGLLYAGAALGLAILIEPTMAGWTGAPDRAAVLALAVPGLVTSVGLLVYPKLIPAIALAALGSALCTVYALLSILPEGWQVGAVVAVIAWLVLANGGFDRLRGRAARLKFEIPGILNAAGASYYDARLALRDYYPPSMQTGDVAEMREKRRREESEGREDAVRGEAVKAEMKATLRQTDPDEAFNARPGRVAPLVALTAWSARTGRRETGAPPEGRRAPHALGPGYLAEALARPGEGDPDWEAAIARAREIDIAAGRHDKPKLVLVATSGGAYRASFWTGVVLDALGELEDAGLLPGFAGNVRLVTGASGGMVGGAYFAAMARKDGGRQPSITQAIEDDVLMVQDRARGPSSGRGYPNATRFPIPRDSLSPVAQRLVQRDLPSLFWPGATRTDRGTVLEDQWDRLDRPFAAMREGERDGWRPSLIFSPMLAETGQPLLISNLDMDLVRRDLYYETVEFFDLFPGAEDHFRLKTAVRLNAAFPYVSPAAALPTEPYLRVVDAGYFDNYGIDLAATYLARPEIRDWILANTSGVVVIQLRAFPFKPPLPDPPGKVARALQFLTTPVEGILAARGSTMTFRHRQSLRQVRLDYAERAYRDIDARSRPDFVQSYMFEAKSETSLNWYLPEWELREIRGELEKPELQRTLARLVAGWWR